MQIFGQLSGSSAGKLAIGSALGAGLATALLAVAAVAQDARLERGLKIVEEKCARCHAVGRSGASTLAKAPPFRILSHRYPLESLAEALAEGIVTGHNDMPEFKFQPHEIDAILTYIGSISTPQ